MRAITFPSSLAQVNHTRDMRYIKENSRKKLSDASAMWRNWTSFFSPAPPFKSAGTSSVPKYALVLRINSEVFDFLTRERTITSACMNTPVNPWFGPRKSPGRPIYGFDVAYSPETIPPALSKDKENFLPLGTRSPFPFLICLPRVYVDRRNQGSREHVPCQFPSMSCSGNMLNDPSYRAMESYRARNAE